MNDQQAAPENGGPHSGRLPARVAKAILNQQDASERLVGWFQLAVVILFGFLYSISPKTFSTANTFTLVPWFLAVYLILTVIRLILAHRSRMSAMATFGAAVSSQSFAADALKTVDKIMAAADSWSGDLQANNQPRLKIGAAVTTGQIIFGAVGDTSRMEYTVIGDAVNLAAKLEKHTKSEGVQAHCTASAYKTARKQGYQPPVERKILENRNIEGVSQPQDIAILAP